MNFVVNSEGLKNAAKECSDAAAAIEKKIEEIYTKIAAIETDKHWVGDSYNSFEESCENYHESLNQLVNILRAYAKLLQNVNTPQMTMEKEIKRALN